MTLSLSNPPQLSSSLAHSSHLNLQLLQMKCQQEQI